MHESKQAVYLGKGAKQNNTKMGIWEQRKKNVSPKKTSSEIKHLYTVTICWLVSGTGFITDINWPWPSLDLYWPYVSPTDGREALCFWTLTKSWCANAEEEKQALEPKTKRDSSSVGQMGYQYGSRKTESSSRSLLSGSHSAHHHLSISLFKSISLHLCLHSR